MNAIDEVDFLGFSYGFRPGRNQHQGLDAVAYGMWKKMVKWVLDADIQSFFDRLSQKWLEKFLEHQIADRRVIRWIQKWLNAGVLEDGKRMVSEIGTVQGGSISPLSRISICTTYWTCGSSNGDRQEPWATSWS